MPRPHAFCGGSSPQQQRPDEQRHQHEGLTQPAQGRPPPLPAPQAQERLLPAAQQAEVVEQRAMDESCDCPAAGPSQGSESPLLQLPVAVLEQLWYRLQLGCQELGPGSVSYQHSMRSTCKFLMQATTPLICALAIDVALSGNHRASEAVGVLRESIRQLHCFPAAATLRKLRWSCWDQHVPFIVLPGVMPALFTSTSTARRLRHVQQLELLGIVAITPSDLASVATTCTCLAQLKLDDVCIMGPLLQPLSKLQSLHTLHVNDVKLPHAPAEFAASFACMTNLSHLAVTASMSHEETGDRDPWGLVRSNIRDILPHLRGLTQLHSLELVQSGFCDLTSDDVDAAFSAVSGLTSLTSLRLAQAPYLGLDRAVECFTMLEHNVGMLSDMQRLACLSLPDAHISGACIRALAKLPRLRLLETACMDPGGDLSDLPCAWEVLKLASSLSPEHVCALPLRGGAARLCIRGHGMLIWRLSPSQPWQQLRDVLLRASHVLARSWQGNEGGQHHLRLTWDTDPCKPSYGLLALLAPLSPLPHLGLFLCPEWDVCAEDVWALAVYLPRLEAMGVDTARPLFVSFAAALGGECRRDGAAVSGVTSCSTVLDSSIDDGLTGANSSVLGKCAEAGALTHGQAGGGATGSSDVPHNGGTCEGSALACNRSGSSGAHSQAGHGGAGGLSRSRSKGDNEKEAGGRAHPAGAGSGAGGCDSKDREGVKLPLVHLQGGCDSKDGECVKLPLVHLQHLHITDDAPLSERARDALLSMAAARARAGLSLAIHCRGNLREEECDAYNAQVAQALGEAAAGAARCRVRFRP